MCLVLFVKQLQKGQILTEIDQKITKSVTIYLICRKCDQINKIIS